MSRLPAGPEGVLLLLGGAALSLAVAAWQFRALRRRLARGRAALLAALRALAVLLVVGALAGPRLQRSASRRIPRPLAVAVDASRSMGLGGGLPETRLERVRQFVGGARFAEALEGWVPEYFALREEAVKLPAGGLEALRAEGGGTDLADALARLAERAPAGTGALVVFTDGGPPPRLPVVPEAGPRLPFVLVAVGAGERPRDIGIEGVEAPGIAFSGQPVDIAVRVGSTGFGSRSVPLLLKRGAQVLASRTVELAGDGAPVEEVLSWTPPAPGSYPLTVEVPLQEGEQVAENNRSAVVVEAQRDKIRVLLVSGSPSWGYRFLRSALKGDPSIDLVSFIILRSAQDAVDVPQQELSLIPFPTQKIFLEELPNFDLLVFADFAFQPYLPVGYLEKVRDFVRGGGAFWMLGGPRSFLGGRYRASALDEVLPLALPAVLPPEGAFREGPIEAELTVAGRSHPFFQGLADPEAPLPALDGLNPAGEPRAGSTVLAEARLPDGTRAPLIVAGRFGSGRTLAVTTDTLWRWAFEEAGRGRGSRAYLAFVRQALRWSVGDPALSPLRVEPERLQVVPGGRIGARVRVLGEDFLPTDGAAVSVTLRAPDGSTRALVPAPEGGGVFRVEADAGAPGAWEILAQTAGPAAARASATVTAAWPEAELRAGGADRETLAQLARRGRGAVVELGGAAETADAIARALEQIAPAPALEREESRTPAEEPWFFLLFLGVVGADWLLRRRSGLD